jgi:uncharacterized protein YhjY with autotransporter beta-barrel domain
MKDHRLHSFCRILVEAAAALACIAASLPGVAAANATAAGQHSPVAAEPLLSAVDAGLAVAMIQNDNVMRRIGALQSGTRGLDLTGLDVGIGGYRIAGNAVDTVSRTTLGGIVDNVLIARATADRLGLFANGHIGTGSTAASAQRIDVTAGADYRVFDRLALGASAGYATGGSQSVSGPAHGALDVGSWRGAMYGTYFDQGFHVDGLIGYDAADYATLRSIQSHDAPDTTPAFARAAGSGRQMSAQLKSAFDFKYGAWTFGPRVAASWVDVVVDPLEEVGVGTDALAVGSQRARAVKSSAGARVSLPELRTPWLIVTPHASADFVRDLDSRSDLVDVRLMTDSGETATSLPVERSASSSFVWTIGAAAKLSRELSGFVNYQSSAGVGEVAAAELSWGLRFKAAL